ncbi:MAG: VTT domain-containing protein [bacterium]|nr:VTT domain-containing protein [bacterium]
MLLQDLLDPQKIITAFGLVGVILIVFAESGLFFGFFLPGDSLLFTAGFLASQGILPISLLLIGTFVAAVLGDSVGYWFGKKTGPALFSKEDSFFFKKRYMEKARIFYEIHGKKTIILARFMPIIRTFAPIIAGIGNMHYRTFLAYNILGGFIWSFGLTLLGYFLGRSIPGVDKYLLPIIIAIIITSLIPGLVHLYKSRKRV